MNMEKTNDKFWDKVAPSVQRALHLRPLTQSQAKKEYEEAPEVPWASDNECKRFWEIICFS